MYTYQFYNPGTLDPRAFCTFGLHAKENIDNPIGQFGTGLKYAIAVILRSGGTIHIQTDKGAWDFRTRTTDFRGAEHEEIYCPNTSPELVLPYTTHLGKNWELWQAYRELASNAMDEGGFVGELPPNPEHPYTIITISIPEEINHNEIFLSLDPDAAMANSHKNVIAWDTPSNHLYYRGIRVYTGKKPFRFTYNITCKIDLTEDRTIKEYWDVLWELGTYWGQMEDKNHLSNFLQFTEHYAETEFNVRSVMWSSELVANFRDLHGSHVYRQQSAWKEILRILKLDGYTSRDATKREQALINRAIEFLSEAPLSCNFDNIPVHMSDDIKGNNLAVADRKKREIFLSTRVVDQGLKQVCATLYEEWLHIMQSLEDNTYNTQSYLFDKIITLCEELREEYL